MLFGLLALSLLAVLPLLRAATLPAKRSIDICAFVSADLIVDGVNFGIVTECLCIDIIAALIPTNPVTRNAAAKTSTSQVKNALTDVVNNSEGASQCAYPPHANPVCTETDPCAYNCAAPYLKRGGNCVLPGSARSQKRDINQCSYGLQRCGIWSSWGTRSYECIDTTVELESCGGCTVPYGTDVASGQDCTQIKGVSDVECRSGTCIINKCRPGFRLSDDAQSCVRTPMLGGPHAHAHAHALGHGAVGQADSDAGHSGSTSPAPRPLMDIMFHQAASY